MILFLDTSAFVKIYIKETASEQVRQVATQASKITILTLTIQKPSVPSSAGYNSANFPKLEVQRFLNRCSRIYRCLKSLILISMWQKKQLF